MARAARPKDIARPAARRVTPSTDANRFRVALGTATINRVNAASCRASSAASPHRSQSSKLGPLLPLCCAMKRPSDAMHRRATESSFASRALIRRALQEPSLALVVVWPGSTPRRTPCGGFPFFPDVDRFPGNLFTSELQDTATELPGSVVVSDRDFRNPKIAAPPDPPRLEVQGGRIDLPPSLEFSFPTKRSRD